MPKIILTDGSEFTVDRDILDEKILSAKPDEVIQLGKNFFKKSSIEIIHGDDSNKTSVKTLNSLPKVNFITKTINIVGNFIKEKVIILIPTKNQFRNYIINIILYILVLGVLFVIFNLIVIIVPYLYSFLPNCNIFIFDFWNGDCN
jgi:hypothetical protein